MLHDPKLDEKKFQTALDTAIIAGAWPGLTSVGGGFANEEASYYKPASNSSDERHQMPDFRPRWWYDYRFLDTRPAIWSLRNRPQEWAWRKMPEGVLSPHQITHLPSNHHFYVAFDYCHLLPDTDCECAGGRSRWFQFGQGAAFWRAFKRWRKMHPHPTHVDGDNFAEHFR